MRNVAVVLLAILLFSFGCVSPPTTLVKDVGVLTPKAERAASFSGSGVSVDALVKESTIYVKVDEGKLQEKYEELKSSLEGTGVKLTDLSYSEYDDQKRYTLTIRAAPEKFDQIINEVRKAGEVKELSLSTEDAAREYAELDVRISNKQTELDRLQKLFNQSTNVSTILEVERELSRVEEDLDVLKNQKRYLVSRIERSVVKVILFETKTPISQIGLSFKNLGEAFAAAFAISVTILVFIAGGLVPLTIAVAALWILYKKLRVKENGEIRSRKSEGSRIPPPP